MPDGLEAWCASIWAPEPENATGWTAPRLLTRDDGSALSASRMADLAYIVSEASHKVIKQKGKVADDYAAAVSVIVHDWTNSGGTSVYDPNWALSAFAANEDPIGSGQKPGSVPAIYNQLKADAAKYHGPWTLELSADPVAPAVGETTAVTGTLLAATGTPVPQREIDVAVTGATPATAEVTTDANGKFTLPIDITATDVHVEASRLAPAAVVMMREPTGWTSAQRPQNMITVDQNKVTGKLDLTATAAKPSIGTSATDQADGDKVISWDGGKVVDAVKYENLTPGQEYTLKGELMDKATGKGTGITGETTFTPETASGTVDVVFTVPAGHAGSTLVAFEDLLSKGEVVASHKDIDDNAQTVTVEEEPVTPGTPSTPVPGQPAPGVTPDVDLAHTGFGGVAIGSAAAALLAAGLIVVLATRRRREEPVPADDQQ
ncbi:MAG: VaFE repeat-containing surface-anchored protein [Arthrobacter sp.]|nr:VaFE repeat-containing surface-anchored protein [Arthrobacter sp.]